MMKSSARQQLVYIYVRLGSRLALCSRNQCMNKVLSLPVPTVKQMRFKSHTSSRGVPSCGKQNLSSVAVAWEDYHDEEDAHDSNEASDYDSSTSHSDQAKPHDSKHCATCTCEEPFCGQSLDQPMPPPLPEPTYTVFKRVLPSTLVALSSHKGRRYLMESLENNMAESYWSLMEHFCNQSDPAFCGVTTLMMVLNAMSVDPQVRWRGGWRFYGDEDVLLSKCCLDKERIRRAGISMQEFALLAKCQGVQVDMKRPDTEPVNQFRKDVVKMVQGPAEEEDDSSRGILVVSFARRALGQTGEGHFSPIAAYHEPTDSVLLLDVARFKYAPYWVSIEHLYQAMKPLDEATQKPRGWFLLKPPQLSQTYSGTVTTDEHRRPVEIVPEASQGDICPVGKIKVEYCSANPKEEEKNTRSERTNS